MPTHFFLLAVIAAALATSYSSVTVEAIGPASLSKTDQGEWRRLREHTTVGDDSELNLDSKDELRALQMPERLAKLIANIDDANGGLAKMFQGKSTKQLEKYLDDIVEDTVPLFIAMENKGFTPSSLQNAIKNKLPECDKRTSLLSSRDV
ncbi:hypothetical protein GN244_ATG03577 [Phytophthora infestans]|uniref:RxLR effector protein n=1 Tax=Phytophthora infestans TaxID=4787 RepID=A0A833X036_PHYIN|nr:hypothetical protein GN244_ATG03577 [Phytophthora infestans]KAF4139235.1 hypothetical protein GN958_ATG11595 [Phytophthora infestans]